MNARDIPPNKYECRDCVHFLPLDYPSNPTLAVSLGRCAKTPIIVNEWTKSGQHRFCAWERTQGECGPGAKNFEARKPELKTTP